MNTRLGRVCLSLRGSYPYSHLNYVVLIDHVSNQKDCIYTTTIPMITKLGKVVTYHEEFPHIKLCDPSMTWFCEVK